MVFAIAGIMICNSTLAQPRESDASGQSLPASTVPQLTATELAATELTRSISPKSAPTLSLFESRFDNVQGQPDLRSISQCRASYPYLDPVPLALIPEDEAPPKDSGQVQMLADSLPQNSAQVTHLLGNVRLRDSRSLMRAEEIHIDHAEQALTASGGVSFESADAFFSAETLTRSQATSEVALNKTQFHMFGNNANGKADTITISADETISFNRLSFSTCPVDQQSWQFSTSSMTIDQEKGRGEAWNTLLKVGEVPVFYLPYISFPVDDRRASGFLSPTFKESDRNGLDVALPVYWNIASWSDATITLRDIENRGQQLGSEFRILSEQSYTEFNFEWLEDDKLLQSQLDNPQPGVTIAANDSLRWWGAFESHGQFNDHWTADISARKVSDSDYFRDFGSGLESVNSTRLSSEMSLSYQDEIWQMRWFALTHQSLIGSDSYRYLPSWTIDADFTADSGVRWQWSSEVTRFEHKDPQQIEGGRVDILPSVSFPMKESWGYLTPKFSYRISEFEQTSQLTEETTRLSRELPIVSLDSGIYLDRQVTIADKPYTHSLLPRIFYSYIPFEDQSAINNFDTGITDFNFDQLWRENRFSGIDRVGDANQVSLSLANSLIDDQRGTEVFKFQVGRIYYLDDRKVQLFTNEVDTARQSPWLAQVDFRLSTSLTIASIIEWDEQTEQTNRAETRINFEPRDNHIVNVSHRYRDIAGQTVEETDFSFAWSLNERWRMVGRWYNDVSQSQTIEALAGIEYESCCWAVRLVAQRYLNTQLDSLGVPIFIDDGYNDGVYFQFVFKGLGSAGQSGLDKLLTSSISGYSDPFVRAPRQ